MGRAPLGEFTRQNQTTELEKSLQGFSTGEKKFHCSPNCVTQGILTVRNGVGEGEEGKRGKEREGRKHYLPRLELLLCEQGVNDQFFLIADLSL